MAPFTPPTMAAQHVLLRRLVVSSGTLSCVTSQWVLGSVQVQTFKDFLGTRLQHNDKQNHDNLTNLGHFNTPLVTQ